MAPLLLWSNDPDSLPWVPRALRGLEKSQSPADRTHRVQRFVAREASHDLPDRDTTRHDPEHCRTTPGQVRLQCSRRAQPCAQRLKIMSVLPEQNLESITSTLECQRVNSLPPNGPRKSAVVSPMCQAISGLVVSAEGSGGRDAPRRHRDYGAEWARESQTGEFFPSTLSQCRAAEYRERHVGSELQRISHSHRS